MFEGRTLHKLEQMIDDAITGEFQESDYDETVLSRIEVKWKQFLGASALSKENLEKEKENVKSLVSDISHQTKTPMANMKLYASLLQESLEAEEDNADNADPVEKREFHIRLTTEIMRQADKLEFLIESLTKMSRLETNIVEVKPVSRPVTELLDAVISDMQPKAEKKKIEVVEDYEACGNACYDMKWTKEALGNVFDNAIKYSPACSRIILSVTEYGLYTGISVKDEGPGIDESESAKIFGRFYRAPSMQQEDGVGIGLYLAREILRKENGYIKVRSKVGEGAEFTLFLKKG